MTLAALTGCTLPKAGTPHEVRELSLQSGFITGVVKIPIHPVGPMPVVIRPIVDDELMLQRGFVVVRFTTNWQLLQGLVEEPPFEKREAGEPEREAEAPAASAAPAESEGVGRWLLAAPRPGLVGRDYFALIAGEAGEVVPRLLDHLETLPEVDVRRIGIGGSSTTGFVALEAFAHEPRLAVAAVKVACGDYHAFLRTSSLALEGDPRWLRDGKLVLDEAYEASLRAREPIRFAADLPPRPLLLQNGGRDPAVPPECALATARAFEAAYRQAGVRERFRFVFAEDRPHDLGPEADRAILAWWHHWLIARAPLED